ncbi:hypothetical protein RDI58_011050 [Solanum bulbocastanum]|uniref:Uncharacterized protein n=1 Tax=Solanum bulbocastanum TaxID=147425 RepID=A0AAN8TQK3_SOLBU
MEEESHRSVNNSGKHAIGEGNNIAIFWSARAPGSFSNGKSAGQFQGTPPNRGYQKRKRIWNEQCDHCKMHDHTMLDCYQIIGYSENFKGKRKPLANHTLYATLGRHQFSPSGHSSWIFASIHG